MALKALLMVALIVGSYGFPATPEDMSIFFIHSDASARIVGGTNAPPTPYMMALTSGLILRSTHCGGSIVTTRHVLTAAHCIVASVSGGSLSSNLRGVAGTTRWNSGGTQYRFNSFIVHPAYVPSTIKSDIGFLITSTDIVWSQSISPVTLNFDWISAGVPTRVFGWGLTRHNGFSSRDLLELRATVLEGQLCVSEMARMGEVLNFRPRPPAVDPTIEICTFHSNGRGTCNGDSGSPLVHGGTEQQIGLVSWGLPCARGAPDIFVRLSAFQDWILQIIA